MSGLSAEMAASRTDGNPSLDSGHAEGAPDTPEAATTAAAAAAATEAAQLSRPRRPSRVAPASRSPVTTARRHSGVSAGTATTAVEELPTDVGSQRRSSDVPSDALSDSASRSHSDAHSLTSTSPARTYSPGGTSLSPPRGRGRSGGLGRGGSGVRGRGRERGRGRGRGDGGRGHGRAGVAGRDASLGSPDASASASASGGDDGDGSGEGSGDWARSLSPLRQLSATTPMPPRELHAGTRDDYTLASSSTAAGVNDGDGADARPTEQLASQSSRAATAPTSPHGATASSSSAAVSPFALASVKRAPSLVHTPTSEPGRARQHRGSRNGATLLPPLKPIVSTTAGATTSAGRERSGSDASVWSARSASSPAVTSPRASGPGTADERKHDGDATTGIATATTPSGAAVAATLDAAAAAAGAGSDHVPSLTAQRTARPPLAIPRASGTARRSSGASSDGGGSAKSTGRRDARTQTSSASGSTSQSARAKGGKRGSASTRRSLVDECEDTLARSRQLAAQWSVADGGFSAGAGAGASADASMAKLDESWVRDYVDADASSDDGGADGNGRRRRRRARGKSRAAAAVAAAAKAARDARREHRRKRREELGLAREKRAVQLTAMRSTATGQLFFLGDARVVRTLVPRADWTVEEADVITVHFVNGGRVGDGDGDGGDGDDDDDDDTDTSADSEGVVASRAAMRRLARYAAGQFRAQDAAERAARHARCAADAATAHPPAPAPVLPAVETPPAPPRPRPVYPTTMEITMRDGRVVPVVEATSLESPPLSSRLGDDGDVSTAQARRATAAASVASQVTDSVRSLAASITIAPDDLGSHLKSLRAQSRVGNGCDAVLCTGDGLRLPLHACVAGMRGGVALAAAVTTGAGSSGSGTAKAGGGETPSTARHTIEIHAPVLTSIGAGALLDYLYGQRVSMSALRDPEARAMLSITARNMGLRDLEVACAPEAGVDAARSLPQAGTASARTDLAQLWHDTRLGHAVSLPASEYHTGGGGASSSSSALPSRARQAALRILCAPDVVITAGHDPRGREIRAHAAILAQCDVIRAMLGRPSAIGGGQSTWREGRDRRIAFADMTYGAVFVVVSFLYTGHAPLSNDAAFEVLSAADALMLPRLRHLAERYIAKSLCVETAASLLAFASMYSAEQLEDACVSFCARWRDRVTATRDWADVTPDLKARVAIEAAAIAAHGAPAAP